MPRPNLVSDEDLMTRIGLVFRDVGYSAASLNMLAKATGLSKASLYHRFPEGKEQMACEVLEKTGRWFEEHILKPLEGPGAPQDKLRSMSVLLDAFYDGGRKACLLNMLSSPRMDDGPFSQQIRTMFSAFIDALSTVALEAGVAPKTARHRAERVVMLLQGALVLSRGLGDVGPFRLFLDTIEDELFGPPKGDLS